MISIITADGNLAIHLAPEDDPRDEYEMLETLIENGYDYIRPEEIAALTAATIIAYDVERDDQGELRAVHGPVYWYSSYAILDPVEEARTARGAVYQLAQAS